MKKYTSCELVNSHNFTFTNQQQLHWFTTYNNYHCQAHLLADFLKIPLMYILYSGIIFLKKKKKVTAIRCRILLKQRCKKINLFYFTRCSFLGAWNRVARWWACSNTHHCFESRPSSRIRPSSRRERANLSLILTSHQLSVHFCSIERKWVNCPPKFDKRQLWRIKQILSWSE